MKQFSDKEKIIIKYIVECRTSNTFVLANVFSKWFDKKGITFDLETGHIKYDSNKVKDVDTILNDEHGIIEIALLIKYLEEKQYIYIIKDKHDMVDAPLALGPNSSRANLAHHLPEDIVNIIKRTLYRVFVTYDLVYIVENNFQSKEAQQLALAALQLTQAQEQQKAAKQQLEISQNQLIEAKAQTEAVQKQTDAAQQQLIEAKIQTAEAKKQTKEAIKQTKEAIKQTKKVNEQTEKVNEQTEKVNEQTQKVNEQTDNSRTQVGYAWIAMACSIGALIASIVLPICFNRCSNEDSYRNEIKTSLQKSVQSTENISANVDSIKCIGKTVIIQNDSIIVNSQKQTDAINHTQRTTKTGVTKTKKRQ